MKFLRIKDWGKIYENNRTRELKHMDWIPVPNKHDGDGYTTLVDRENGAEMLGAWLAILQVASKCDVRGTLLRDGAVPHNSLSLARITRLRADVFERVIPVLINECQWLENVESIDKPPLSAQSCDIPAPSCGLVTMEGKGREENGREEKKAENGSPPPSFIKEVFDAWNEMAEKIGIPRCLVVSDSRRRSLQARQRDKFFIENWNMAMGKVVKSKFCKGDNERGWTATFDWFIKPENFTKVMEGKYDDRGTYSKPKTTHIPDAIPRVIP